MGPLDHIIVDQATHYTSKEMKGYLEETDVRLHAPPFEKPGSIEKVELYHEPLRYA